MTTQVGSQRSSRSRDTSRRASLSARCAFVAFANEEPPFFQTEQMGSLVYARGCAARHENVVAMLALETIGYYSDAPNSQHYSFPFSLLYPSTGNLLAFVGNLWHAGHACGPPDHHENQGAEGGHDQNELEGPSRANLVIHRARPRRDARAWL
jgi:hypothetical protein